MVNTCNIEEFYKTSVLSPSPSPSVLVLLSVVFKYESYVVSERFTSATYNAREWCFYH